MNDERIVNIETKISYHEDTIVQLNNVVCEQQKQIDALEATCKLLIERIRELSAASDSGKPKIEIPPHY